MLGTFAPGGSVFERASESTQIVLLLVPEPPRYGTRVEAYARPDAKRRYSPSLSVLEDGDAGDSEKAGELVGS